MVIFTILAPSAFPSAYNLRSIVVDASTLLVMAVGQTFVIATAGIDLSNGSVLVFSGIVSVEAMKGAGGNGPGMLLVGVLVALAAGIFWGFVNGFLVTKARIPALITTLGTLGVAFGVAEIITGGNDITGVPSQLVSSLGEGSLFGTIPWLFVIAALVTVAAGLVLRKTRFGRYTLGIGSNIEASRRVGIKVDRHLIKVYALAGVLAGLAGYLSLAQFATTTIQGHSTDNLQVITAVVLGGTSLFGGLATMTGTFVGVFIPAVLESGLVIVGVKPFWQEAAIGVVLLGAVYFDRLNRRQRATE